VQADEVCPGPVAKPHDEVLHVRKYRKHSGDWFTSDGVLVKRRKIEKKGLPDFKGWRFITLTIDPAKFDGDPLQAFLTVKPRVRHFLMKCRNSGLWAKGARWCWKLEFQANGFPHWHLLVERTEKFTLEELASLGRLWGYGRTNVERLSTSEFAYSFKYAFKPAQAIDPEREDPDDFDNEPLCAPAWFLDYHNPDAPAGVPKTFAGVRFWQTYGAFYSNAKPAAELKPVENPNGPRPIVPAREKVERHNKVQGFARKSNGKYIKSAVLVLSAGFGVLANLAAWHSMGGHAVHFQPSSYALPVHVVARNIETTETNQNKLWTLQQENRLSLRAAKRLVAAGKTLQRC